MLKVLINTNNIYTVYAVYKVNAIFAINKINLKSELASLLYATSNLSLK